MVDIFDDFSEFCCIFGTLHFEKSSNTENSFGENEDHFSNYFITFKMAAFATKNVHSERPVNIYIIYKFFYDVQVC